MAVILGISSVRPDLFSCTAAVTVVALVNAVILAKPSCNLTNLPTSVAANVLALAVIVTLLVLPFEVNVVDEVFSSCIGPRLKSTAVIDHAVWLVLDIL